MPRTDLKALPIEEAVRFFRGNGFAVSINQQALLASPDAGLVASVLAVVEREAEAA